MSEPKEEHEQKHPHGHSESQEHDRRHEEVKEKVLEIVEVVEVAAGEEVIEVIEVLDIEEFAKNGGGRPPKAKKYKIRVDKNYYVVDVPSMTGRQILEVAGKTPTDRWMLNQKHRGGKITAVGLDEVVDFIAHEVERFMTLPKDQTEGCAAA